MSPKRWASYTKIIAVWVIGVAFSAGLEGSKARPPAIVTAIVAAVLMIGTILAVIATS